MTQDRELDADWEEVDRLTDALGNDDEKNVLDWLKGLIESEAPDLINAETAMLTVWTKEGKAACFRIGWRMILWGLLEYSKRCLSAELKNDYEEA